MSEKTFKQRPWAQGPLYSFLMDILPGHRTAYNILDVPRLTDELSRSHEAIYKWLRSGRLKPDNAMAICNLANAPLNVDLLKKAGRKPPTIRDFDTFVYAAA